MNTFLPFVVSGIATGAIYGLAGTGLVLTYKTSGIFNFAHGAIAAAAAYVFYWLNVDHEIDWKVAFFLSVFVLGPVLGMVLEVVARHLAPQRTAMRIVGTIGMILLVQGLATIKYGTDPLRVPQYLPRGTETFELGGVIIGWDQVIITAVALSAVAGLYALFRFTRMGVAMRAVVDDPDLVGLHGTSARSVRRIAWMIGVTFAAASGVLVAPALGVESITLTFLVVAAIGAVAIGGFSSIPLTYLGGIAIGIVADVSKKYVLDVTWLAGFPPSVPFIALIIVLLVLPKRKLQPPSLVERRPPLQWRAPAAVQVAMAVIVLTLLVLVPELVGNNLSYYMIALTTAISLLSLGLLVRTSGQVSLAHAAFAGIGAVSFAQFGENFDLPWVPALLLGSLVVVPVAALVAIPATRLAGLFLALATLAFGIFVERLLYPLSFMFGKTADGRTMPRPSWAGFSDQRFYYVILACFVVSSSAMVAIHRSRHGRMLRAMSDSPTAVSTLGLSTTTTRVIVFCISGFFAGMAGILYGCIVNFATYGDRQYQSFNSLILLAILAIVPFGVPWYALFAAISAVIPAYFDGPDTTSWLNVLFGFFAIMVAVQGGPATLPVSMRRLLERLGRRAPPVEASAALPAEIDDDDLVAVQRELTPGLQVQELTVRFGGLLAVHGVNLEAPRGRITGLIGPNGAGKTTTFNACSGLNRPTAGRILLHGADVTHLGSAARARRGLGRTFQITQLCESLTVADNVSLGREASMAGSNVVSQLVASPLQRREAADAADAAMELCGITHLARVQAGELSTGQRRLVELARCIAGPFDVLLLDEPSSGLDHEETVRFGEILTGIVAERRCGILLVEHDVSLVMRICSYIYVLDFGELIFEGTPGAVASSSLVKAAYLGDDAVELREAEEAQL